MKYVSKVIEFVIYVPLVALMAVAMWIMEENKLEKP